MAKAKYTPEQKAEALRLYAEHGAGETHRLTGIPKGTLTSWAGRNGVQSHAAAKTAIATEASKIKWAERRQTLADQLGDAVADFVAAARKAAADGDGRNTQALMTAAAISVDKAQLVSGGATSRHEDVTDPERRLALVRDLKSKPGGEAKTG